MMRSVMIVMTLLFALTMKVNAQSPQDPKAQKAAVLTADLFIAIRDNSSKGVKTALAKGADPNARNWLSFTALMWAAMRGNQEIVDTLLAHHAKLEDGSLYGSALTFAIMGRHEALALHLLEKGARPYADRLDKASPLIMAANNGDTTLVQRLLARHQNPNTPDTDGAPALIYAARSGRAGVIPSLIKAGAIVDVQDSHGRTALMYAAANGQQAVVDLLLANHARVDIKDKADATALLLAARYSGAPGVVQSLLRGGANVSLADRHGETSLTLATARGYEEAARLLTKPGVSPSSLTTAADQALPAKAAQKSLAALQSSMKTFSSRVQCVSCHHQGMGLMTLGIARQQGFAVDQQLLGNYLKQVGEDGKNSGPFIHQALSNPDVAKTIPAVDIGDISIGAGYIFAGLIANQIPGNPGLEEMAQFLATQQAADGHWGFGFNREPIQSSYLTTTALVLQVLHAYGNREKLGETIKGARQWLKTTPTPNTEDKASRLLGLKWSGGVPAEHRAFVQELLAMQRSDGGWSQLPNHPSDAYATGLALYALHEAGEVAVEDPAYQRGIRYLLRTQDEDGSWYVNKRANPANTYLDGGFPHGESQYASFGATVWATLALMQK